MHKWGLAPSPNCECGACEQTADYVLTACPIHRTPHEARGLTVLFYLFLFYLFYLYIYPPDSQESDGGANT